MSTVLLSSSLRKPALSIVVSQKAVLYGNMKAQMFRHGLIVYVHCAGKEVWRKSDFPGEFHSKNFFNNTVHITPTVTEEQKKLAC